MEETIVRQNLMNQEGYSPYCGSDTCSLRLSRAKWNIQKEQFTCSCGWVSGFPIDFIERYKSRWNK